MVEKIKTRIGRKEEEKDLEYKEKDIHLEEMIRGRMPITEDEEKVEGEGFGRRKRKEIWIKWLREGGIGIGKNADEYCHLIDKENKKEEEGGSDN